MTRDSSPPLAALANVSHGCPARPGTEARPARRPTGRLGERSERDLDRSARHPEVLDLLPERIRQRRSGRHPAGGDLFRERGQRRAERLHLGPQLLETLVGPREAQDPRRGLIEEREHLGVPRSVLPLQALELPDPFSDRREPGRIQRESLAVRAEIATELSCLRRQGLGPSRQTRGGGVELDDRSEASNHRGGPFGDATFGGEDLLGGRGELRAAVPRARAVLLRAERIRLAGLRRDRPDLFDLVAEEIELAFTIARIILQPAERPSCRRGALVRLSVGSDGRPGAGHPRSDPGRPSAWRGRGAEGSRAARGSRSAGR
jgi:hypothetical protein